MEDAKCTATLPQSATTIHDANTVQFNANAAQ